MRLADMILSEMEPILRDFEDFARTHTAPGADMDVPALRDHAEEMLRAFARDMNEPQTAKDQKLKSWGQMQAADGAPRSAAELHGSDRAGSGFTLAEMFAEYRALRASVLRHWMAGRDVSAAPEIDDIIRFNEAIDQATAESINRYSAAVNESREMYLAVLGHDLRTPISAIQTASTFLLENGDLAGRSKQLATSIRRSGERMNELVNDLLDFTLTRLGMGIPVKRVRTDMVAVVRPTIEEMRLMHPTREFRFESAGDVTGAFDPDRVAQAVSNLLGNAIKHGASNSPVTVVVRGENGEVIVAVRNRGNTIPDNQLRTIFEPFRRGPGNTGAMQGGSIGLGLHIALQIARAHGGTIDVDSSTERGTTFSLRLPREPAAG